MALTCSINTISAVAVVRWINGEEIDMARIKYDKRKIKERIKPKRKGKNWAMYVIKDMWRDTASILSHERTVEVDEAFAILDKENS